MIRMNVEDYPIIAVGSVKNIRLVTEPTDEKMGECIFEFTDDTSVRDRGKLGFATENKGASMCATAVYNFQRLEALGIPTVFRDQVADNALLVDAVRVIDPDKVDLSTFERRNRLFPVQVITRDVVTDTSSAAKRLRKGTLHYAALGLTAMPEAFPVVLPMTYVDGSTKLRTTGDDYLPWDQLKELACATTTDMNTVREYILKTTAFGQQRGAEIGFLVFDHKDEYAYNDTWRLILTDVPLCLDEITGALVGPFRDLDEFRGNSFRVFQAGRVHDDDAHVNASKQLYRDHYDADHPEWGPQVKAGLKAGKPKSELPPAPKPPEELVGMVSRIYQAFANAWIGEQPFKVPGLAECIADYKKWAQGHYELQPVGR